MKRISHETDISVESISAQVNKLIYNKNRKQLKMQERKVQSINKPDILPRGQTAQPTSVYKAERMLLNLMFFNNSAFRTAKSEVSPDELTDLKNRDLFQAIIKFKETDDSCNAPVFLSSLPEETKALAADILYKEYMGDSVAAVKDNINKIKKQNLNNRINKLAAEGKIDEINALIKKENERRSEID